MKCAIVLAAGASKRMGTHKLLLPFRGKSVIRHIADTLAASRLDDVCVVVGHAAERVRRELPADTVRCVVNSEYRQGMLSSVRCGLRALPTECNSVMVALGDQPGITTALVNELIDAFEKSSRALLVPTFEGRRGHPLVFSTSLCAEVFTSHDDVGLKGLLSAHPREVAEVAVEAPAVLEDLDTPQDYARAIREHGRDG